MKSKIHEGKINVALVGGGGIAINHLKAIEHNSEHLNLVAVCDKNKDALDSLQLEDKVLKFNDYEDMIRLEGLDLVSICTPSGLHPKQTILAAERSLNVLTEKPMSIKWQDGKAMIDACKKSNTNLFVVKQNRYNKMISLLKEVLTNNLLGRINLVQSNVFWTRPQSYYDAAKWRGTKEHDGGALMNQASHYIDLLYWLFGPVLSVDALTSTSRNIETEDTGVLNLNFKSGALGSMSYSMLTYPKNFEGSITVLGEKGTIKIGGPSLNKIEKWDIEDDSYLQRVNNFKNLNQTDKSEGHKNYYKNVIDVLKGQAQPICNGEEGLKSLEILVATYLSAQQKKTIYLPLE